jgi:agmatine deiminase
VNQQLVLSDYKFNGWGGKFEAAADNGVTKSLFDQGVFADSVAYRSRLDFILEGGSIESNGQGLLLTTSRCLLASTRNQHLSRREIEQRLKADFYLDKVLWLENGQLQGDDTDGHVDTLARFCDANTIAYVACEDESDDHFAALQAMQKELQRLTNQHGEEFKLIALPMVPAICDEDGNRLAATYANFLIINGAVLLPVMAWKLILRRAKR